MNNATELEAMVELILPFIPTPERSVLDRVFGLLRAIAESKESEVWKELGDKLLEQAKDASSNAEFNICLMVGSACVGVSIGLEREKKLKLT